jgi:DNA-directed RNA polymerase subunit K/omega
MDANIDDQSENQSEILTNIEDSQTFYKLYDTKNNMITNILNKYEKTKIIYERYQMISNGSVPYISNPEKYDNIYDIVIEELKQKKLPFIIKRTLNGNDEYLKLEDFIII